MNKKALYIMIGIAFPLSVLTSVSPVPGQTSTNYDLTESTFNSGGHPADATILTSASFRISIDAIGDGVRMTNLSGVGYQMAAGFVPAYPPPGEVTGFQLTSDQETLTWDPEPSVGVYKVYAGSVAGLSTDDYGACLAPNLTTTLFTDAALPNIGEARVYFVTAENRLGEEGTKGWRSGGVERPEGPPCP